MQVQLGNFIFVFCIPLKWKRVGGRHALLAMAFEQEMLGVHTFAPQLFILWHMIELIRNMNHFSIFQNNSSIGHNTTVWVQKYANLCDLNISLLYLLIICWQCLWIPPFSSLPKQIFLINNGKLRQLWPNPMCVPNTIKKWKISK